MTAVLPPAVDHDASLRICIKTLSLNQPLAPALVGHAINEIMSGNANQLLMASFLSLLTPEKFTAEIVAAAATAMRSHSLVFPVAAGSTPKSRGYMDIVGTGGDGLDTFNVSTTAAIVVAACGVPVVKHGNRSSSSKCGSADLIEATGAHLNITTTNAAAIVSECNFAFLFSQAMHPSMKHVAPLRKTLAIKTLFNVLGPLTNPCIPAYQLTGVYDRALGLLYAQALQALGVVSAIIVHSDDGMDEISLATSSHIWWLHSSSDDSSSSNSNNNNTVITEHDVHPERDFGLPLHSISDVASGTAAANAVTMTAVLAGAAAAAAATATAAYDHVLLNAATALVAAQHPEATSFRAAVAVARAAIESGAATRLLQKYVSLTQEATAATAAATATAAAEAAAATAAAAATQKTSILAVIAAHRDALTAAATATLSFNDLLYQTLRQQHQLPQLVPFLPRLHMARYSNSSSSSSSSSNNNNNNMCLVAEIKRASPSAGIINNTLDVVQQALQYSSGNSNGRYSSSSSSSCAAAISVLCEPKWFKGSLDDLRNIRAALERQQNEANNAAIAAAVAAAAAAGTCAAAAAAAVRLVVRPALLLKDFVSTPYQIVEGRAAGCDSVLLIVASLTAAATTTTTATTATDTQQLLKQLIAVSRALGMEPLVEVATAAEMVVAVAAGAVLVGINNRNLHTFTIDTQTTVRLASAFTQHYSALISGNDQRQALLQQQWQQQQHNNNSSNNSNNSYYSSDLTNNTPLLVALSGIKTRADVVAYAAAGAGAVLVGETLMRSGDCGREIRLLLGTEGEVEEAAVATAAATTAATTQPSTAAAAVVVKICGFRYAADAVHASRSCAADLLGLIFVPASKRCVNEQQAQAIAAAVRGSSSSNSNSTATIVTATTAAVDDSSASARSQHYTAGTQSLSALIQHTRSTQQRSLLVGVFVNESVENINKLVLSVPLDLVQLHGSEGVAIAAAVLCPVIRAVSVAATTTAQQLMDSGIHAAANVVAVLLDTACSSSGGSGQTFDWSVAAQLQQQHGMPVLLAGGLTAVNVAAAVQQTAAFGVDTASGVEYTDTCGLLHKQWTKMELFVRHAKTAAAAAAVGIAQ